MIGDGEVTGYGEVARALGLPRGARAVARVLASGVFGWDAACPVIPVGRIRGRDGHRCFVVPDLGEGEDSRSAALARRAVSFTTVTTCAEVTSGTSCADVMSGTSCAEVTTHAVPDPGIRARQGAAVPEGRPGSAGHAGPAGQVLLIPTSRCLDAKELAERVSMSGGAARTLR